MIAYRMHREQYSKDFTDAKWDTQSKKEACGLLAAITSFDFITSFMTIYQFLSHLEGITVKIHSTFLDILKAYDMVSILQMSVAFLCLTLLLNEYNS